jgi:hypothetical protein
MPTKKFEPDDFAAFLALLPAEQDGIALRHVVEARHESFCTPDFIELLAKHNVAAVCADHETYPMVADVTSDFVYARLQRGSDDVATCYPPEDIDLWANRLRTYAEGGMPSDLALIAPDRTAKSTAARCLRLLHHRRQGQCACRCNGAAAAALNAPAKAEIFIWLIGVKAVPGVFFHCSFHSDHTVMGERNGTIFWKNRPCHRVRRRDRPRHGAEICKRRRQCRGFRYPCARR